MGKMDEFKSFVKENPRLIKYVRTGEMDWQKFYEIYDLYGKEETAWAPYLKQEIVERNAKETVEEVAAPLGIASFLKALDLDTVQNGVSSLQRVVGLLQELGGKGSKVEEKPAYKPRPIYKHFED
ncbi:MAG: hypothetical protein KH135_06915 [Firmicutes bacterium]|nr:hypothetical protein [Bacillota bacterium]